MKNILISVLLLFSLQSFATEPDIILLKPTGQEINGLLEMEIYSDTSQVGIKMKGIIEKSMIKDFLEIHNILQIYLYNTTGKPIEPAYLALTENQGGFARKGFVTIENGLHKEMQNSFYVDINKARIDNPNRLMSITQLYPHELGHIMYRLLSSIEGIEESSKNINIHFFSLVTDYPIAFNEGFAEHIENISRLFESNQEIIKGIHNDTIEIVKKSQRTIKGFTKDFEQPWRIGFFKMSMLFWYQQFEDYKRFAYTMDGRSKFVNSSISTANDQKNLIYRNSGVQYNSKKKRNKVQLMASEGTISSFFTLLSQTIIKDQYLDETFYKQFQIENSLVKTPQEQFTPLQNLFIKYFYILDNHVKLEQTDKAQLIDFIEGYIKEFPEEANIIIDTYNNTTGTIYNSNMPPPLWLLIKDQNHGILALDAYAGLTLPVYTFDINAAEKEDLMMIDNLTEADAKALLDYRDQNGLFIDLSTINSIDGISGKGKEAILSTAFDEHFFNNIEFPEELNINSVILAPIKYLIKYMLLSFIIVMSIYFTIIYKEKLTVKKLILTSIKYLLLWIVFMLSGLIIAAIGMHWYLIFGITLTALLLSLFYKGIKRRRSVQVILIMTIIILVSLI